MKKKALWMGAFACLIASMSWGAMFPVADHALQYIDPFYFATIRYGIVSLLLVILLWWREGSRAFRTEGKMRYLLFFGTMAFTVYNLFIFMGQSQMGQSGVIVASIMETLMPIITILIIWFLYKTRPKNYMLLSIIVAFIGASLVITKGELHFFSELSSQALPLFLIFLGVTGWVVYTMGGQRFIGWSTLRYSTLTCLIGTSVTAIITGILTWQGSIVMPTMHVMDTIKYDMLFMSSFPGIIALLCWNYGVKQLNALNGVLFINFVPITTLLIMMWQGYQITVFDLVGTSLVIIALVANNLYQRHDLRNRKLSFILTKKTYRGKHFLPSNT
ncbi:transporter [Lysinibacillus alkalisoli]|uniref:Transporter n=1 Tax=Lysinibacillus alkalisoli TaxID=1911548 RepID=A0A917LIS1_9BACI|nr:DMT family transporter [Lysinibacillus alkalisoli]GGG27869.1 transporter [Lysinibacillus alkalisoli]